MARDLALEQRWRERIAEYRQSGMSVKAWCQKNGLKSNAYHYWVKKFNVMDQQGSEDSVFAEVVLLPENKNNANETLSPKAEISLSFGGYSIGIPEGFNPVTLAELVEVLRKL